MQIELSEANRKLTENIKEINTERSDKQGQRYQR